MGFNSNPKRIWAGLEPLSFRVMLFCECLDKFSLFGFTETYRRLQLITGAEDGRWTEDQLLAALDYLSEARASWVVHAQNAHSIAYAKKRADTPNGEGDVWEWWRLWKQEYLVGYTAELWLMTELDK